MTEKEVEKKPDEVTNVSYMTWFDCFSSNASVYMPEFLKTMEKKRKAMEAELLEQQAAAEQSAQSATENTPITVDATANAENSNLS